MQLCSNPLTVLHHVAKMANDNNPCFVEINIKEMAEKLTVAGNTKSFYDYLTVVRKRNELIRDHVEKTTVASMKDTVSSILNF